MYEIVNNTVRKLPQEIQKHFSVWQRGKLIDSIVKSQEFVRNILGDSAYVSLRDVARCLKIFEWLMSNELKIVQSLALVYYFRLDNIHRNKYNKRITQDVCGRIAWFNNRDFTIILNQEIELLCTRCSIKKIIKREIIYVIFMYYDMYTINFRW